MPPKPPLPEKVACLRQQAQTLIELGRSAEAVPLLHQVLAQSPHDAKTMCLLSQSCGELKHASEAERWAEQAIVAAPDLEWGHRLLAWHLLNQGGPNTALSPAQEAVRLKPEGRKSLYVLAKTQRQMKRFEDALETAACLRAVAPEDYSTHETLALIAIDQQHWSQAEAHCREALKFDPACWQGLNNLGLTLTRQLEPDGTEALNARFLEGLNCLYHALRAKPTSKTTQRNLSKALRNYLRLNRVVWQQVLLCALLLQDFRAVWVPFRLAVHSVLLFLSGLLLWQIFKNRVLSHRRFHALPIELQAFWRSTGWVRRRLGILLHRRWSILKSGH